MDKCAKFALDVPRYPQNVILCWPPESRAQQPGVMDNTPSVSGSSAFSRQPRVRVSSPADVLAVVPHLLGFHPARSLVVMGVGRPRARVQLAFRYDLPDPPDAVHAADIAEHAAGVLRQRRLSTVIGVGYGPGTLVTPVADALAGAVRQSGLRLHELMRVEDGRYWSYLCENPACCPADGVPFDVQANPAAAAMTVAGLVAYPDRAALARTLASVTGAAARSMEQATSRARERAAALIAQASGPVAGRPERLLVDAGRRAVQEAIATYRAGGRALADEPVAWLTVVLAHLAVRDDAWSRMDPGFRDAHLRLWTDVVRRATPACLAAPASLLALHRLAVRRGSAGQHRDRPGAGRRPGIFAGPIAARHHGRGRAALGGAGPDDARAGGGQLRPGGLRVLGRARRPGTSQAGPQSRPETAVAVVRYGRERNGSWAGFNGRGYRAVNFPPPFAGVGRELAHMSLLRSSSSRPGRP